METNRAELLKGLEDLRAKHGEDAYVKACRDLSKLLILQPRGEEFLKGTFPDLDLDAIRKEAERDKEMQKSLSGSSGDDLLSLMRLHVPSIQTQSHFDVFMSAFKALTLAVDSYFSGNFEAGDKARDALGISLDMAKRVSEVEAKIHEIPPEQRSPEAAMFVEPPKEFKEVEEQRRLLAELDAVPTQEDLNSWYKSERLRIDSVVTKKYRDELFDAIRDRQRALSN